jgi:hypothetical protein
MGQLILSKKSRKYFFQKGKYKVAIGRKKFPLLLKREIAVEADSTS